MTLMDAAKKWGLSVNWIRELVKSGRVQAKLRTDVPVPYYEIPDGTPKPPSMARVPYRKGGGTSVTPEAIKRRKAREDAAKKAKKAAKKSSPAKKV